MTQQENKPEELFPFDQLDPGDGFCIEEVTLPGELIELYVGVISERAWLSELAGQDASQEVWSCHNPQPRDYAARDRLKLVLDWVCRYFNSGGSWDELDAALASMKKTILGGFSPPGYHLLDVFVDTEGAFTQFWVRNFGDQVVCWVEDDYIDTELTLMDVHSALQADDDEVSWGDARGTLRSEDVLPGPTGAGDSG